MFEPRPAPARVQGKLLNVRLRLDEFAAVETAARAAGQTLSDWIRAAMAAHLAAPGGQPSSSSSGEASNGRPSAPTA